MAGCYTLSYLPTTFGTFAWNPNIIPFLSTLALWLWTEYIINHRKKVLIIIPVLLAITVHLHYQAVVLAPFYLLALTHSLVQDKGLSLERMGIGNRLRTLNFFYLMQLLNIEQNLVILKQLLIILLRSMLVITSE